VSKGKSSPNPKSSPASPNPPPRPSSSSLKGAGGGRSSKSRSLSSKPLTEPNSSSIPKENASLPLSTLRPSSNVKSRALSTPGN
jgi:hypothetical protein